MTDTPAAPPHQAHVAKAPPKERPKPQIDPTTTKRPDENLSLAIKKAKGAP